MKEQTDLTPFITGNSVLKAWILTDGEENKDLVIKFKKNIADKEKAMILHFISKNLLVKAENEDEKEGGESTFGNIVNGMKIREWRPEDDEFIKDANPHNILGKENI